jgi:hypothetical protein
MSELTAPQVRTRKPVGPQYGINPSTAEGPDGVHVGVGIGADLSQGDPIRTTRASHASHRIARHCGDIVPAAARTARARGRGGSGHARYRGSVRWPGLKGSYSAVTLPAGQDICES